MPHNARPIVLANEPRAYREALAASVAVLRPGMEVLALDPADLDAALRAHRPRLVVCSRLTSAVEREAPAWVLLYPDGARLVVTHLHGREVAAADLDLVGLLALLDGTSPTADA